MGNRPVHTNGQNCDSQSISTDSPDFLKQLETISFCLCTNQVSTENLQNGKNWSRARFSPATWQRGVLRYGLGLMSGDFHRKSEARLVEGDHANVLICCSLCRRQFHRAVEEMELQKLLTRFVVEKQSGNHLPVIPTLIPGA